MLKAILGAETTRQSQLVKSLKAATLYTLLCSWGWYLQRRNDEVVVVIIMLHRLNLSKLTKYFCLKDIARLIERLLASVMYLGVVFDIPIPNSLAVHNCCGSPWQTAYLLLLHTPVCEVLNDRLQV